MSFLLPLSLAGIGDAIGNAIGDLELAVSNVVSKLASTLGRGFDTVTKAMGKFVDWFSRNAVKLAHMLLHYFRVLGHYIMVLLRYVARVMTNFYHEFQRDPLTSLQFVGTMMIIINGGLS